MKYETQQTRRVEMPDAPTSRSFGIAGNAKMFEILFAGIYKRPMDAIVREIVSNIFDAHLLNGHTGPGKLVLPSPLQPVLVFRDFGPGLSDDGMQNLYTQMGVSTKEDDPDAIGNFGLGSKTPLAYTDAFTAISRHQGVMRVYTVVKGDDGIPVLQSDDVGYETDEPDGLEVAIPVKPGDNYAWQQAVHRVLSWFPEGSVEVVGLDYPIQPPAFVYETDKWALLAVDRPSVAQMGPIVYELDFTALPDAPRNRVVFKMPLGSIRPQPSREGLTYTPSTTARLNQAILDFQIEFTEWITKGLDGLSPWDLAIAYRKLKNQWSGFPLPLLETEVKATAEYGFVNVREGRRRRRYSASTVRLFDPSRLSAGTVIQPTDASIVILNDIEDPRDVKIKKRLKENSWAFDGIRAMYIVDDLAHVGSPSSFKKLSDFDLPAKDERIKATREKRERPVVYTIDSDLRVDEQRWDEPNFGSVYAELNLKTIVSDRKAILFARSAGRAVFGLTKRARTYYRDVDMISAEKYMADKLASMRGDRELLLTYLRVQAHAKIPSHDHIVANLIRFDPTQLPVDCRRLVQETLKPLEHPDLDLLTFALSRELMALPGRLPRAFDFVQASARIRERYPVFAKLCNLAGFHQVEPEILLKSLKIRG